MQFTGKITFIGEEEVISDKFTKQTIVLQEVTDREFAQTLAVDFSNKKLEALAGFKIGDVVEVSLNSKASQNKDQTRWFNNISGWRIDLVNDGGSAPKNNDDLPF